MSEPIYHLAEPADWTPRTENYSPSSLEEEGFIHCSTADQLPLVARELFADRNDLVVLTIDPERLEEGALVYEDLYDLGKEYPHVYGSMPIGAVIHSGPYLTHLEEGLWTPEKRFNREWMERMLHPEFTEVGMSGRTYTRLETIAHRPIPSYEITLPLESYRLELINADVALARYVSRPIYDGIERAAHRSSVWVGTDEGWRIRFHQGTPLP